MRIVSIVRFTLIDETCTHTFMLYLYWLWKKMYFWKNWCIYRLKIHVNLTFYASITACITAYVWICINSLPGWQFVLYFSVNQAAFAYAFLLSSGIVNCFIGTVDYILHPPINDGIFCDKKVYCCSVYVVEIFTTVVMYNWWTILMHYSSALNVHLSI